MERGKSSKIRDPKTAGLLASVNYEFARKCHRYEPILSKLADDLLNRYSPKQHPHPDFFKQDAALASHQLTLFSDQYLQVMRQFEFLSTPASIMANFSSAALRINDFLANKLFQYMRVAEPLPPLPTHDSLCASCGKQRENEKIRALRDELGVGVPNWNTIKIKREIMARTGEKYDMEELMQEELENLDSLNEEEVRKRLNGMELDHDRRRNDMLACIEELKSAGEKVTSYSRGLDKKGRELGSSKFDIKDYVFQLSRHFSHNLSNIDNKLQQLKQHLSPLADTAVQTEHPCLLLSQHHLVLDPLNQQLAALTKSLAEHSSWVIIEQQKSKELEAMTLFLEDRLKAGAMLRDEEKLERTLAEAHLKGTLAQNQSKIASMEAIIKKLKRRSGSIFQDELPGNSTPTIESVTLEQDKDSSGLPEVVVEEGNTESRYTLRHSKRNKVSAMLKPRFLQQLFKLNGHSEAHPLPLSSSLKNIVVQIYERHKCRLAVHPVVSESVSPTQKYFQRESFQEIQENFEGHRSRMPLRDTGDRGTTKKPQLGKMMTSKKRQGKLDTLRNRRSVLGFEQEHQESYFAGTTAKNHDRTSTLYDPKSYQMAGKPLPEAVSTLYKQPNRKKRRHFSQENSFEDEGQVHPAFDREVRQKRLFHHLNQLLQISRDESEKKPSDKKPQRGEYSKAALSLEEISYSTSFYSLMAGLRLQDSLCHSNVKKYLCQASGFVGDEERAVKESLKLLLVTHRKCVGDGSLCGHMQTLLERVKSL